MILVHYASLQTGTLFAAEDVMGSVLIFRKGIGDVSYPYELTGGEEGGEVAIRAQPAICNFQNGKMVLPLSRVSVRRVR